MKNVCLFPHSHTHARVRTHTHTIIIGCQINWAAFGIHDISRGHNHVMECDQRGALHRTVVTCDQQPCLNVSFSDSVIVSTQPFFFIKSSPRPREQSAGYTTAPCCLEWRSMFAAMHPAGHHCLYGSGFNGASQCGAREAHNESHTESFSSQHAPNVTQWKSSGQKKLNYVVDGQCFLVLQ